jgi:hypothetical protein
VFDRAVADADSLADMPVVQRVAAASGWLRYEAIDYLVDEAFTQAKGDARVMDRVGVRHSADSHPR